MATRGKAARDPRRIYCEQYDYYWKFTLPQFLAFCNWGIKYGNHDLNKFGKPLKGKPKDILKPRETRTSFSASPDILLFHPLDWNRGDYPEAAKDTMKWWKAHEPGRKR